MARIRCIKPQFWTDKRIIRLSRNARLFFIGLWNFADDHGVLEADPLQLKAWIFPVDTDIGEEEIQELLQELENQKLIHLYQIDGESYLWIRNFLRHQKIDRPRKTNLPLPEEALKIIEEQNKEKQKQAEANKETSAKSSKSKPKTSPQQEVQKTESTRKTKKKQGEKKEEASSLCPYQEIVNLYHLILSELPRCMVVNENRKRLMRSRWNEVLNNQEILSAMLTQDEIAENKSLKEKGLRWFEKFFNYVKESDFLTGKVITKNYEKPFIADLEWLMRPNNFAKVIEGKYHKNKMEEFLSSMSPEGRATAMAAMNLIQKLEQEEEVPNNGCGLV